jgi:acyl transferase domain-containing protein
MRVNLLDYLKSHSDLDLADLAFTLQVGRKAFPHRLMLVCQTVAEAVSQLEAKQYFLSVADPEEHPVVFMFPGQGSQYVNMGRELYDEEPTFREEVDTCAKFLGPYLQRDLREVIYPPVGQEETAQEQLDQTSLTQPAIFVIEYATAQLWMKRGVRPRAMIGHSIGEYVAACLAGIFSLEDALFLVTLRGRLMQQLPNGSMLAVSLPKEEILAFLGLGLSLAAHNSTTDCVVSGSTDLIEQLEYRLTEKNIPCRRLHGSHAFHSQMMDSILERFTSEVEKIRLYPPTLPYISNLTGTWITEQEATDPSYWAKHLRQTVRFAEGVQILLNNPAVVLLEIGPGRSLTTLARRMAIADRLVLPSLRHPQAPGSDSAFLLNTCGQLWCAGVAISWSQLYAGERRRRISLPTYPFERERYWIFPQRQSYSATDIQTSLELLPPLSEPEGTEQVVVSTPHQRPNLQIAYVPPRNETEQQIAAIWQNVLGIEKVGIQDNLFEAGGDSLMGIRIINQLRNVFEVGLSIPMHLLFTAPTIEGMAEVITRKQKS